MISRLVTLAATVLLILSAGCHPRPGTARPGDVAKEWSLMMREYNISPVFPPREDFQPGDILALPLPPDVELEMDTLRNNPGRFLPNGVLLHRMYLNTALKDHYDPSLSLPATPNFGTTSTTQAIAQPTYAAGSTFKGDVTRPRLGGFPEAFSVQLQSGNVGGVVPTEILNVVMAATGSKSKTVKISVPMVETVGLPAFRFMNAVKVEKDRNATTVKIARSLDGNASSDTSNSAKINPEYLKLLTRPAGGYDATTTRRIAQLKKKWEEGETAKKKQDPSYEKRAFPYGHVVLVTEVFYTRSIDVSVVADSASALGANVTPTAKLLEGLTGVKPTTAPTSDAPAEPAPAPAPTPAPAPAEGTGNPETPGPANGSSTAAPTDPAERARQTQQNQLKALNEQLATQTPGVKLSVSSVTASGVSMKRVYERPVAIGYRGIVFAVDDKNGVQLVGVADSVAPVAGGPEGSVELPQLSAEVTKSLNPEDFVPGNEKPKATVSEVPGQSGIDVRLTPKLKDDRDSKVKESIRELIRAERNDRDLPVNVRD